MSKTFSFVDENGELYPEWGEKALGDCVRYNERRGSLDKEFFYVDLGSVTSGVFTGKNVIQKDEAPSRAQRILVDGDVLFQNVRPYQKNNVVFRSENWDKQVVASTGFTQMSPQSGTSSEFLYHTVMTDGFNKKVMGKCTGTSYPAINSSELMKVTIPLPSLPEQKKIAEFFSALDERIELQAKKVALLKEQKQGYLQKVFARELVCTDENGDAYPEWEQKKLGEVSTVTSGKRLPKGHGFTSTGVPYISVSDMGDRSVDQSNLSYISIDTADILRRYKVSKGDVVISIAGTLGKVNIIGGSLEQANLTENCDKIRANDGMIPEFIFYVLKSPSIQSTIDVESTTSSQPKLALERLRNFSVPVPSISEQEKIASFFSALDEQVELTANKLTLLKEQKKGYLQGIFG